MQYPGDYPAKFLNMKRFFESHPAQVLVKICGVTNQEDAEDAIEAGADAIGLNLVPRSKRYIDLEPASGWITELPPAVARIVVAMDPTIDRALHVLSNEWVDGLQLHGQESPDFCELLGGKTGKPLIKAIPAIDRTSVQAAERYPVFALLLDSSAGMTLGGTGQTFDWQKFAGRTHPGKRRRRRPGVESARSGRRHRSRACARTKRPNKNARFCGSSEGFVMTRSRRYRRVNRN